MEASFGASRGSGFSGGGGRVFTYDDFDIGKVIGRGAFATVHLATLYETGEKLVLKVLNAPLDELTDKERAEVDTEIKLLGDLQHENVIRFLGYFVHDDVMHIVMEYAASGSLDSLISKAKKSGERIPDERVWELFAQLVQAVRYVHSKNVLHRDLKAQNVMLSGYQGRTVKLGDFGISKSLETEGAMAQSMVGTPYYLSPEICEGKPYDNHSDVWALGCILYELVALSRPFEASSIPALIMAIMTGRRRPLPGDVSPQFRHLVEELLTHDPSGRPTVDDIAHRPDVSEAIRRWESELMTLRTLEVAHTPVAAGAERTLGVGTPMALASPSRTVASLASTAATSNAAFMGRSARDEAWRVLTAARCFAWGEANQKPRLFEKLLGVDAKDFCFGADHKMAMTSLGEVFVWGSGSDGQLGLGGPGHTERHPVMLEAINRRGLVACDISAGYGSSAVVLTDGRLLLWGALACTRGLGLVAISTLPEVDLAATAATADGGEASGADATFVPQSETVNSEAWPTWAREQRQAVRQPAPKTPEGAEVTAARGNGLSAVRHRRPSAEGHGCEEAEEDGEASAAANPFAKGGKHAGKNPYASNPKKTPDATVPADANPFARGGAHAGKNPYARGPKVAAPAEAAEPNPVGRGGAHKGNTPYASAQNPESTAEDPEPVASNPFARGGAHKGKNPYRNAGTPKPQSVTPAAAADSGDSSNPFAKNGKLGGRSPHVPVKQDAVSAAEPTLAKPASPNPFGRGGALGGKNPYAGKHMPPKQTRAPTASAGGTTSEGSGGDGSGAASTEHTTEQAPDSASTAVVATPEPDAPFSDDGDVDTEEKVFFEPQLVTCLKFGKVAQVSCGKSHTVLLTANGQLWTWGINDEGQLGLGDDNARDTPCQITEFVKAKRKRPKSSAKSRTVGASARRKRKSVAKRPQSARGAKAARDGGSAAARSGSGEGGESPAAAKSAPPKPFLPAVTHVSAGADHTLCVAADMAFAWGSSEVGQLGLGDKVEECVSKPTEIVQLRERHIVFISAGDTHSGAVSDDGRIWMWGSTEHGKLGLGSDVVDEDGVWEPRLVPFDRKALQISCGGDHTVARVEHEGEVFVWGSQGFEKQFDTPHPVGLLRDALHVEANRWGTSADNFAITRPPKSGR